MVSITKQVILILVLVAILGPEIFSISMGIDGCPAAPWEMNPRMRDYITYTYDMDWVCDGKEPRSEFCKTLMFDIRYFPV